MKRRDLLKRFRQKGWWAYYYDEWQEDRGHTKAHRNQRGTGKDYHYAQQPVREETIMRVAYPIVLTPAKEGGYIVSVPDLEIGTQGENIANAIYMATDAIGLYALSQEELGNSIPAPSAELPSCRNGEVATYALVDFDAYRRAYDMRTIRKNVTLPSYLNDAAEKAGLNFSRILQDGIKQALNLT